MKKFIALFFSIILIVIIICSCSKNTKPIETETDENSEIITTASNQTTTKNGDRETTNSENTTTSKSLETTSSSGSETNLPNTHGIKTGYSLISPDAVFVETPSRVIVSKGINGRISYYSKADGGLYTFCFDPLCDHKSRSCFTRKFNFNYFIQPVYSEYSGRLYLPRKDCLYSSKFDGTDIRLEIALGEHGKDLEKTSNGGDDIKYVQSYDNYIYFSYPTVKSANENDIESHHELYRYNVDTKKLENLFENTGYESHSFQSYFLSYDKIFFSDITDDGIVFYSADMDMTGLRETKMDRKISSKLSTVDSVFDGEKFYMTMLEETDSQSMAYIVSFDPEKEEIEKIYSTNLIYKDTNGITQTINWMTIKAVTDKYIYFTANEEPFLIGKYKNKNGDSYVYLTDHTMYRINKDGTDKVLVFEGVTSKDPKNASYSISEMYISNDKIIAQIYKCEYSAPIILPTGFESQKWRTTQFVTFDIAPDGSFVNMHELVLDE